MWLLLQLAQRHPEVFLTAGVAYVALSLLLLVILSWKLFSLRRRLRFVFRGPRATDLEGLIQQFIEEAQQAREAASQALVSLHRIEKALPGYLKNIGLVHYDAYEDVGGQLSFSLALLNNEGTGIILTSLYGRNSCNTYAKGVEQGNPTIPLSEEEQQALQLALYQEKRSEQPLSPTEKG